jgi:hypothetical protein
MDMIERACRALCRYNGVIADADAGGVPAWQLYRSEVAALITSLRRGDELSHGPQATSKKVQKGREVERQSA